MNKRYGWSKFIIMVPSIAIREGVQKSLQITAEHFTATYGQKARFFTYNSKRLHELESFSSDAGINVMVINIQAFAAKGADNKCIYDELDDFQSRRPIDVIASNRPILILDEPQKMEGPASKEALPRFKPLMILRYSATHKTTHNKVHRLDAVDAYNQKLVKRSRCAVCKHAAWRALQPQRLHHVHAEHSDNTISRRQEVGSGLRLSVDKHGERMDNPAVVHDINVLTVVASESYKDFVGALQKEIAEGLSSRPRQASEAYFKGKVLATETGPVTVTPEMAAKMEFYLVQQGYVDWQTNITDKYHQAKTDGALAGLPDVLKPYAAQVIALIDTVFSDAAMPKPEDGRKPKTNALNPNFDKQEFKELWARINQKAVYRVAFDSAELVAKCVSAALHQSLM
jgi:restriction endonuclease